MFLRFVTPLLLLLLLAAVIFSDRVQAEKRGGNRAGDFDYYSLVVSWSPTFCDSPAGRNARHQCAPGRRYAFVVHGLWPQHERGWPQNCRVKKGQYWLPKDLVSDMTDIMPARGLVIHQWKKHGTCSGLTGRQYFNTTRRLFEKITIPARYIRPNNYISTTPQQLEKDFLSTNKWLDKSMISVHCGRKRRLKEVRFCFDRDLSPRSCGSNENRECRTSQIVLPPVR